MKFAALLVLLALAAVADASRDTVFRSLLQDPHKKPIYCKKDHKDDCPEHYECKPLGKEECKYDNVCTTDAYGNKKDCVNKRVCWDHKCEEVPRYCDPYAKYDECDKKYGKDWECKKLDHEQCKYKDECRKVKTHCTAYDQEDKCIYVRGKCIEYNQKKQCRKQNVCVEFKQEQKCDQKKVCKKYKQRKECKKTGKCAGYDAYGNCNKYGEDCHLVNDGCQDYEYQKHNCRYQPTKVCKKYASKEVDCKYINTSCKKYDQIRKCEKVQKGCKTYAYKDECKKVKDVCWKGKCEKKRTYGTPTGYGSSRSG